MLTVLQYVQDSLLSHPDEYITMQICFLKVNESV